MPNPQKEAENKLTKGLLDFIVLQILKHQPMHGYQIILRIRQTYGIYFGPSTIYPLLGVLETKGYLISEWDLTAQRPRKVYQITNEGSEALNFAEKSLNHICKKLTSQTQGQPDEPQVLVFDQP